MSRLAKKPIVIPAGTTVKRDGAFWIFKGPKGEIKKSFSEIISITEKDGALSVELATNRKGARAILGTTAVLVKNAVEGVTNGFEKKLEIEGIGYKAQPEGTGLTFALGFSHPVKFPAPDGITLKVEKNLITVQGADKEHVGRVAADIRALKVPEPYKGKGIHYLGEVIRRKAGKKAVGTTG